MFRPSYNFSRGRIVTGGPRVAALAGRRAQRRKATIDYGGSGLMGAGGDHYQTYSPVYERAEDPTLAEEFMPTDRQTQNKIFRNILMFDPVAGPATEYWRDLAFSRYVRLGGLEDADILQFYEDAIEASGIERLMPWLLNNYLTFGNFVMHMVPDKKRGYWKNTFVHDPDTVEIIISPFPGEDPIINWQPDNTHRDWALSRDPRITEQQQKYDPEIIKMMALTEPVPLPAENTLFMARMVHATDDYGTSYLTRIIPFKIMEKALIDATVAGARRRAGPLWTITVPEYYEADMIREILDQCFAAEEDPIGGKIAIRDGVTISTVGGGSADYWKLSDEYDFLRTAKMNALGISDAFVSGEATYSSMEKILQVFVEKLRSVRNLFTEQVIVNKMFKTLARQHGFVYKKSAQVAHHYRIARRDVSDADLIIPSVEWDKPLEPMADFDYWDLLERLEQKGFVVPKRKWAQAAGYDFAESVDNLDTELDDRERLYQVKAALAKQAEAAGFDMEGNFIAGGEIGAGGGLGGEPGGFEFGPPGGEELELPGGEEMGGPAELEMPPEMPELAPPPELPPPGGEEGAGASPLAPRFHVPRVRQHRRYADPVYPDLEQTLSKIPIWDMGNSFLGLPRRRVAQLVDQLAHRPPEERTGRALSHLLHREGLSTLQAGIVQYCAARLGYVARPHLPSETIRHLEHCLVDRADQEGLTEALNREMEVLVALQNVRAKTHPASFRSLASQDQVPDHQILTGLV